ncbi:MAG: hypothetical protein CMJ33_02455 [Phycisphaerae bacterium]|nr:hypothetical protein [Phycisphaerae bacterium]
MIRGETNSHVILVIGAMFLSTACLEVHHDLVRCDGEIHPGSPGAVMTHQDGSQRRHRSG